MSNAFDNTRLIIIKMLHQRHEWVPCVSCHIKKEEKDGAYKLNCMGTMIGRSSGPDNAWIKRKSTMLPELQYPCRQQRPRVGRTHVWPGRRHRAPHGLRVATPAYIPACSSNCFFFKLLKYLCFQMILFFITDVKVIFKIFEKTF